MQRALTVGLDGSPESLAAARWATDEAERRNLTLRLLHAWPPLVPEPTRVPSEVDQNYWARRLVHNARAELQSSHPGLTVLGNWSPTMPSTHSSRRRRSPKWSCSAHGV